MNSKIVEHISAECHVRDQGVQQERMETEPESNSPTYFVLQPAQLPTMPPPPIPLQQAAMPPSLPQVPGAVVQRSSSPQTVVQPSSSTQAAVQPSTSTQASTSIQTKKGPGRPKGSKNKPKDLTQPTQIQRRS